MSVLDASVVLKWFVSEQGSEDAVILRHEFVEGDRNIVVPDLLLYECANALKYHPDFTVSEVQQSIDSLFSLGIDIVTPTASLLKKATEISFSADVTVYDALYLALADEIKDRFITADEKFYQAVTERFPNIIFLL